MPLLPAIGTLSYNGYTFSSLFRSRLTAKPVYTASGMTVKHVTYFLRADGVIDNAGNATDTTLEDVRRKLTAPAGDLYISGKGMGDNLTVNVPGGPGDVEWGPKPELLDMTMLGNRAALVTWQCTFSIPECSGAAYENRISCLDYSVVFNHDHDGYTERTVSGYYEIPITRNRPRVPKVPDTADAYREKVVPEIPLGFQRTNQSFNLSQDKRRMDFNFVDKELPVALPPNCTLCDIEHTVAAHLGAGSAFAIWTVSFTGTINVSKTQPKSLAFNRFALIVRDKLSQFKKTGATVLPQSFSCTDQIFGRGTYFNCSFTVAGQTLATILKAGRRWHPLTERDAGGNAAAWRVSLALDDATHPRGYAKAKHAAGDLIIDLCDKAQKPPQFPPVREALLEEGPLVDAKVNPFTAYPGGVNPETAWLEYQARIEYDELANVVRHKPLKFNEKKKLDQILSPGFSPGKDQLKSFAATLPKPTDSTNTVDDIFQRVAGASCDVALYGYALRIGHRIPLPSLVTVGGRKVIETRRRERSGVYTMAGDVPIFFALWRIDYQLARPPSSALPVPQNPQFDYAGVA